MKYQNQIPVKALAKRQNGLSERKLAAKAGLSRECLRSVMGRNQNVKIESLVKIADYFERDIYVLAISSETGTEFSTFAATYNIMNEGFNSWKIHFMDFVDEFRRTLDPQLFLIAPPQKAPKQLKALLSSIVLQLCEESGVSPPLWARKRCPLDKPWFVSGMESLKAAALIESPLAFRRNNIFVLDNFLRRV